MNGVAMQRYDRVLIEATVWKESNEEGLMELLFPGIVEFRLAEGCVPIIVINKERLHGKP